MSQLQGRHNLAEFVARIGARTVDLQTWAALCPVCRQADATIRRVNHGLSFSCPTPCQEMRIAAGYGVKATDVFEEQSRNRNPAIPKPANPKQQPFDVLASIRNGGWLADQTFPPTSYVVPGLIPEGYTVIAGAPKIGKSWLALAVALAAASGGRALGLVQVQQRPALYLALEDGERRLQYRCRVLLGDGEPIPEAFEYLTRVEPSDLFATLRAWYDRHPTGIAIVDTLGKVAAGVLPAYGGEGAYARDYRIGSALKQTVDEHPGAALGVNHHERKAASEDFVGSVSGTNGLTGAADTVIRLTRKRTESAGLIEVTGRDVEEAAYALLFTGGRWTLDGADMGEAGARAETRRATAGTGDRMADVIAYVTQHPETVDAAAVSENVGIDRDQARVYLNRAAASGRIERASPGRFRPVSPVTRVTPEIDLERARNSVTVVTPLEDDHCDGLEEGEL
jgi:hypothetical protein